MTQKSNKIAGGCLSIVLMIMMSVIVFALLYSLGFTNTITAFASLVISSFFVRAMLKQVREKGRYRYTFPILFVSILVIGFGIFMYKASTLTSGTYTFEKEDVIVADTIQIAEVRVPVLSAKRSWRDNSGNNFQGTLSVREEDHLRLENLSAQYTSSSYDQYFWGDLYDFLEQRSNSSLDLLYTTFETIGKERGLNRIEFADMVTSCIQDIPYSLVFENICMSADQYEEKTIRDVLRDCPECCVGNKAYGIQAPVEFIATLKGDCDSRTVLIYSILKHFGYDVAILNSDEYRHSILGLNVPASGKFKAHGGKRYYVWETTSKYFNLGQLAPGMENLMYWDIVLLSK
ncbi:MAG: hypothetical protein ABJM06_12630 [Gilvibacter sp.]